MGKKKMGRPKLARGKAKAAVITVRMAKAERVLIGKAAKTTRLSVSKWIRETLLEAATHATMQASSHEGESEGEGIEPRAGCASSRPPRDVKPH
jgi:uncharacterized protein DUF6290